MTRSTLHRHQRPPRAAVGLPVDPWYFPRLAWWDAEARMAEMQRRVAAGHSIPNRTRCQYEGT